MNQTKRLLYFRPRILPLLPAVLFCFFTVCFAYTLRAQTRTAGKKPKTLPKTSAKPAAIDRKALVERHTVHVIKADTLSSLSVGNGKFAFTVDVTGLQTFPVEYEKGISLGTQSEWGWNSFKDTAGYRFEETLREYNLNGRKVSYSVQINNPARNKNAANWFRQNPHRLQLGNVGFYITKEDGTEASLSDIRNIQQQLNMWTGEIKSHFTVEGIPVDVSTFGHQDEDVVALKVLSPLILKGRLKIRLRFPYPTGEWSDVGTNWTDNGKHTSSLENNTSTGATLLHQLDSARYYVNCNWKNNAAITQKASHDFIITPGKQESAFEFSCRFSPENASIQTPSYTQTQANNGVKWKQFWSRGGAVDFSGSTDPRAFELERRIILSQYLLKIQEAGYNPPQETGLTYNSWYGKAHMEMPYWHSMHYALWGRTDLLENIMSWYIRAAPGARQIAQRQGYEGIRWQKMTDNEGREDPSSVGAFLIWQQPHFIYFTELCYREHKDMATLNKWKDLVFATADFMASFARYDSATNRYVLGKGVIPAQERFKAEETFNPTYELVYWNWALSVAQQWRERLKLPPNQKWNDVIQKLSALPTLDTVYLPTESARDAYTNPEYRTDHPSVLGALGMMPQTGQVDVERMEHTFNWIWNNWTWKDTWGWDFPMVAMTATRLGMPDKAVDALLMNIQTNTYLPNGHNYQDDRLRLYLPGNGGLLSAVAMMCAGYDGSKAINPGIPKNGWKVRWEGLRKTP